MPTSGEVPEVGLHRRDRRPPVLDQPRDVPRAAPAEVRRPRCAVAVEVVLRLHPARLSVASRPAVGGRRGCEAGLRTPLGSPPMSYEDVWLVIPLYNEGTVIGDVVREARATFPHVVCVDDGSTDDSAAPRRRPVRSSCATRSTSARARPCRPGSSTRCRVASMRWVVTFDADGQHQVDDVVAMLDKARAEDLDVVFGSRFLDDRTEAGLAQGPGPAGGRRLHQPHDGHPAHRRPQRSAGDVARRRGPDRDHPEPDGARLRARRTRSGSSASATARARCTSSTPTTPASKGQSLWNAVNILADLILR